MSAQQRQVVARRDVAELDHATLVHHAVGQMLVMRRVVRLALRRLGAGVAPKDLRLGEGQYHALHALYEHGPLNAGDLAHACSVSDPTISKMLKVLEHGGLVARQTDPTNRRVVWVSLTPQGREMHDKMVAKFDRTMAEVLAPLNDDELRDLIVAFGHLERLVGAADAASQADETVL